MGQETQARCWAATGGAPGWPTPGRLAVTGAVAPVTRPEEFQEATGGEVQGEVLRPLFSGTCPAVLASLSSALLLSREICTCALRPAVFHVCS